ncbi:Uncharacterised protein [Citrobacter freundii]|nr:Uncharacterised protein [Citrobacter freundii]
MLKTFLLLFYRRYRAVKLYKLKKDIYKLISMMPII